MIFPEQFSDPQKLKITQVTATQSSKTHSGNTLVGQIGRPHQWQLEITTPPLDHKDSRGLYAFLCSLNGRHGTCSISNPMPQMGVGVGSNCITSRSYDVAVDVIEIDRCKPNSELLCAGDFIQFEGHSKVHIVKSNVYSSNEGRATISLAPPLRRPLKAGSKIKAGKNVRFTVSLKSDSQKLEISALNERKTYVINLEERE